MIPYDDLVAALQAWRARQGLPVNQLGGGGSGPTPSPGSGPHAKAGSGPNARPGSGPNRPPAPPPSASRPGMPVMQAEPEEVVADMLDEDAYENEGSDFSVGFGAGGGNSDATAIGGAPERPTETDMRDDKDDW
jgi:hypothetical protein